MGNVRSQAADRSDLKSTGGAQLAAKILKQEGIGRVFMQPGYAVN